MENIKYGVNSVNKLKPSGKTHMGKKTLVYCYIPVNGELVGISII